jgi:hypothetical protein
VAEPLRVVDKETGELIVPGCRACHDHTSKIAGLESDLVALQEENLRLIRANKALKRDRAAERLRHRRRREVEAIFEDWKATVAAVYRSKAQCKLSPERFDVIVARLNDGYTAEHFQLAAYGAVHANPWNVKAGQEPLVEIATFAKQGNWLEQYARAGAMAKRGS